MANKSLETFFFKIIATVFKKPGKASKSLGIVKLRSTRVFLKNPGKFGKRPERVKLLSQQIFLESWESFEMSKNVLKKVLESWKNSWESELNF